LNAVLALESIGVKWTVPGWPRPAYRCARREVSAVRVRLSPSVRRARFRLGRRTPLFGPTHRYLRVSASISAGSAPRLCRQGQREMPANTGRFVRFRMAGQVDRHTSENRVVIRAPSLAVPRVPVRRQALARLRQSSYATAESQCGVQSGFDPRRSRDLLALLALAP